MEEDEDEGELEDEQAPIAMIIIIVKKFFISLTLLVFCELLLVLLSIDPRMKENNQSIDTRISFAPFKESIRGTIDSDRKEQSIEPCSAIDQSEKNKSQVFCRL